MTFVPALGKFIAVGFQISESSNGVTWTPNDIQAGAYTIVANPDPAPPINGLLKDLPTKTVCPFCPKPWGQKVAVNSSIDTSEMSYEHDATDYDAIGGGGCSSCGGGSPLSSGKKPSFSLTRYHRYLQQDLHGSFGHGVFSNFDIYLMLYPEIARSATVVATAAASGSARMEFWDPSRKDLVTLIDDGTGHYRDAAHATVEGVRLFDGDGNATANVAIATTAVLTDFDGQTLTFEIIPAADFDGTSAKSARLTRLADRSGNAMTIAYAYNLADLEGSDTVHPSDLWRIASVTDAYGCVAHFTYTLLDGSPVVAGIALPNGAHLVYSYGTIGLASLQGVTLPDGTTSTFTTSLYYGFQAVTISDAAAEANHRVNLVYFSMSDAIDPFYRVEVPQPPNHVRAEFNGEGELCYSNWIEHPSATLCSIYQFTGGGANGTGSLMRHDSVDGVPLATYRARTWSFNLPTETYTWDLQEAAQTDGQIRLTGSTDALGRSTVYERDATTGAVTGTTRKTATGAVYAATSTTYNSFKEPLVSIDELGRETDCAYDASGNLLSQTTAAGTVDAATTHHTYTAEGLVASDTDANGNQTDYAYDTVGRLIAVTDPPDYPNGPRATRSFTYNAAGLVATSTDAEGRTTGMIYDGRNRLVQNTYLDGSTETFTYGTDITTANLLLSQTDRDGNVTAYAYDRTGRRIATTIAATDPYLIPGTTTVSYLPGTSLPTVEITDGNETDYTYDTQLRCIATTTHPNAFTSLTTHTVYDANDRVAYTQDPYGRRTYPVYDVNDRVIRQIQETVPGAVSGDPATLSRILTPNPPYLITETDYDLSGQVASTTDARGIVTTMAYDHQGRLITRVEATGLPESATTQYAYDAQGNQTEIIPPRQAVEGGGFSTISTYTGRNLLATTTVAAGTSESATTSIAYTLTGKSATTADARGNVTTYTYGTCCDRLIAVTDPSGAVTSTAYDHNGNVTATTDANGNTTTMTYDGRNRLSTRTDGAGGVTTYQYQEDLTYWSPVANLDPNGKYGISVPGIAGSATMVTDPNGNFTISIHDGIGRTVGSIDANGNTTICTYDGFINTTTAALASAPGALVATDVTDPLGHTQSRWTDGAGRSVASVDAAGMLTVMAVDANGNTVSTRDPNAVGTDAVFDGRNRCTLSIDTHGATTAWTYDAANNVVTVADALNQNTTTVYDHRDRKISTTDRINATTAFTYDADNNLLTITDAENGVTTYHYNGRNLLLSEHFPGDSATRCYAYDPGKRLTTRTDQSGTVTTYAYDAANRMTARHYPDGLDDALTYDAGGRLTSATSGRYHNEILRAYDAANRLTEESLVVLANPERGTTVRYDVFSGYDNANRQTLISYPDGKHVTRTYTDRNDLETVRYDSATVAARTYDDGRRLHTSTAGNGLVETRTYRDDNLISTIAIPGITGFAYDYDADKRMTAETDTVLTANAQTFAYDAADRLNLWHRSTTATQAWELSPVGDWNVTAINGVSSTRSHNAVHEITAIDSTALAYDANGNLTNDGAGMSLTLDPENHLATATTAGINATYAYDALGRRVQKTVNDLTITYVSSGAQEIYEVDTDQSIFAALPATGTGASTVPPGGILDFPDTVRVNFQPATSSIPTGYLADTGDAVAPHTSATYGWLAGPQDATAERNRIALPAWDTFDSLQIDGQADGVWQYALPNGTYPVVVVLGDAAHRDLTNNITINGTVFNDPYPYDTEEAAGYEQGKFTGFATDVTVDDGILTITTASGATHANLCFVEIGPEGGTIDDATRTRLNDLVARETAATAGTPPKIATRSHIFGSYVDEPLMSVIQGAKYYISSNHLYSVAAVSDSTGAVVERYAYSAFGARTVMDGAGNPLSGSSIGQAWGFTGRREDEETGLVYQRDRMYSPQIGRFIGRDPIGYLGGMDLYSGYFVPNSVDPTGDLDIEMGGMHGELPDFLYPWAGNNDYLDSFSSRYFGFANAYQDGSNQTPVGLLGTLGMWSAIESQMKGADTAQAMANSKQCCFRIVAHSQGVRNALAALRYYAKDSAESSCCKTINVNILLIAPKDGDGSVVKESLAEAIMASEKMRITVTVIYSSSDRVDRPWRNQSWVPQAPFLVGRYHDVNGQFSGGQGLVPPPFMIDPRMAGSGPFKGSTGGMLALKQNEYSQEKMNAWKGDGKIRADVKSIDVGLPTHSFEDLYLRAQADQDIQSRMAAFSSACKNP